jgi:3-hydroxy-3-methylglutaryl CoA synthase
MSNKTLIITYISTHNKTKEITLQPVNYEQYISGRDYKIFKLQIKKNVMVGGKKKSKKSHKKRKSRKSKKSYKKRKSRKSKKSHKKRKSRKSISN